MQPIYLDHNSTTPLLPAAWEAMAPFAAQTFGNPASAHFEGRRARRALEDAREKIAALLGAFPDEVIFTSGATEANNLALFGLMRDRSSAQPVLASPIEHPCVAEPLSQIQKGGVPIEWLNVDGQGVVSPHQSLNGRTPQLVTLMLVNHDTGAIQPVREIAHLYPHVPVHTDAAQAVGKMAIDFHDLGVNALTASAHKFGGPKGVGLMLLKRGQALEPILFGGHQQGGRRPGTEPVALVVGMAVALEHSASNLSQRHAKVQQLRNRLWDGLIEQDRSVVLNGPDLDSSQALATTLNVSFPGCRSDVLLMAFDLAGVACSAGSACSSGSLLPSPTLLAMGLAQERTASAIRFSLSPLLTVAEIDDAVERITAVVRRMRAVSAPAPPLNT